jgi:putative flavoprotein involved in K+ transport
MGRAEVVDLLQDYAAAIAAPVEEGTTVVSVRPAEGGFAVETDRGAWRARAVVVATGACDRPAVPGWASALAPEIVQVVPGAYRNPEQLPGAACWWSAPRRPACSSRARSTPPGGR